MLKKCFQTISISFVLLFCLVGIVHAGLVFEAEIPVVSDGGITIDGNPIDWNGIQPMLSDLQNDSICETGTDIKDYYLARDNNFLYWRVDTWSGTFSFGDTEQEKIPVLLFYEIGQPTQGPYPNGITVNISADSSYVSGRYDNTNWTGLYGGAEYGMVGSVAEGKVALSDFNPFVIKYINAYYWMGADADPQCDEVDQTYQAGYNIPWLEISTRTYAGSDPITYFWFEISDGDNWNVPSIENVIQSAEITYPDSTQTSFTPRLDGYCTSEYRASDNNRNGVIEIDQSEYEKRVSSGMEYEIISPISPHSAGTYNLEVICTNGQTISNSATVLPGLSASELPPLTNVSATFDQQTGLLKVSWSPPENPYPGDSSIDVSLRRYEADGSSRYIRYRARKLLPTKTSYSFFNWESDLIRLFAPYIEIKVRVYSGDGSNSVAQSEILQYAVNGYTLTPTQIKPPLQGDMNQDGLIGLEEAIHALQVISDIREE